MLFLSCHLPWPAISGGRRRELELLRRLSRRFDVHLLVVSKTPEEDRRNVLRLRRFCRAVEVLAAGGREAGAPALTSVEPRQVVRHHCPGAAARVAEILTREEIDLVHVEGYYLMQHVPQWIDVPLLLAEQNVEYELEHQRLATAGPDAADPAEYRRTEAAERRCWERAWAVAAVTPEDQALISRALPERQVRLVPDGADHMPRLRAVADAVPQRPAAPLVTLLANFAYSPNVDAALHLCHHILPGLRGQVPDVHLWLVGNAPPSEVRALAGPAVRVTGRVPDVVPYLDAADVVACPLRIGGGIKVKAIEALRRGRAMVATSVGAQGLPEPARQAVVIADDPTSFANALARLLRDPARRAVHEQRALRAAAALPTWDEAAEALEHVYADLLEARSAATAGRRADHERVTA